MPHSTQAILPDIKNSASQEAIVAYTDAWLAEKRQEYMQ